MNSNYSKPVNLGNSAEYSIESLAIIIRDLIGLSNKSFKTLSEKIYFFNFRKRQQQYN
jgi:hypothetical protein